MQIVHNVVNVADSADSPVTERRCPHCKRRLVSVRTEDVELSGCGRCGGIWIDNDSSRRVLERPQQIFAELAERAAINAKARGSRDARPTCAQCPTVLDRVRTHGIEIDVCSDHGTWFDAYELRVLVQALTSGTPAKPASLGDAVPIHCASCRQPLSSDRANITEIGLTCEGCWRRAHSAAIAASEQAQQSQGIAVVGGVLLGVAAVMLGASSRSSS